MCEGGKCGELLQGCCCFILPSWVPCFSFSSLLRVVQEGLGVLSLSKAGKLQACSSCWCRAVTATSSTCSPAGCFSHTSTFFLTLFSVPCTCMCICVGSK